MDRLKFHYDIHGAAMTFAHVNSGVFTDGRHYPFVLEAKEDGRLMAHGTMKVAGVKNSTIQDFDDRHIFLEMVRLATEKGGWLTYRWPDPTSGEVKIKQSWFVLHDGYIFSYGHYFSY